MKQEKALAKQDKAPVVLSRRIRCPFNECAEPDKDLTELILASNGEQIGFFCGLHAEWVANLAAKGVTAVGRYRNAEDLQVWTAKA